MTGFRDVPTNVEEIHLSARVVRADGSVEDFGEVAYYHKNPLRRLLWRLARKVKRCHSV